MHLIHVGPFWTNRKNQNLSMLLINFGWIGDMMKVFVYYNLHSGKWSVKALEKPYKGKVLGHAHTVVLSTVSPSVSASGRARVLREGKKNVHAGLVGELLLVDGWQPYKNRDVKFWEESPLNPDYSRLSEITYNPYKYESFVYKANGFKYDCSSMALLNDQRRVYVLG